MFSPHTCSLWRVLPVGFALLLLPAACGQGGQPLGPTPTARVTTAPSRSPTSPTHLATCPQTATPLDKSRLTGRIAYSTFSSPETTDVYVMRADGSEQKQLTTKPGPEFDPSWSPDGKQLVYRDSSKGINHDDEIYVMNADDSGKRNLTNNPANDWGPAWSPDGSKIAFESRRDGNYEIYMMNADGSGQRNLTHNPADDDNAQWSPDGSKLVFDSERDSTQTSGSTGGGTPYPREIYVMNVDGSGMTQLTSGELLFPDWTR